MPGNLSGKRIILAGGSGGLGSATARSLAAEGASVLVSYRQNQARAATLSDVAEVVQGDLTVAEDRSRLLEMAGEFYGLVVFAGDPSRVKDPSHLEAMMQASYQANYLGPIQLAREAADRFTAVGVQGSIVLFSTMQAVSVFPGSTVYAGAKAALLHSAKILAKELRGPKNIRVNVVCPGVIAAGMAEASIAAGKYGHYLESQAIPRYGRAEDIAKTVRFLLEPDNYITGQVLTVDGGLTL